MSPTQRTQARLKALGWTTAIVERWNQYAKVRQDLFGFIDVLAIKGPRTIGVQTTTCDHLAERIEKIRNLPAAHTWACPGQRSIILHGWSKRGDCGERKLWFCRVIELAGPDLDIVYDEIETGTPKPQ